MGRRMSRHIEKKKGYGEENKKIYKENKKIQKIKVLTVPESVSLK
jgi:hypothetical protein